MRSKPLIVSRDNIVSAIQAWLQAVKAIPDSEDVVDIQFSDLNQDPVTITVHFKEEVDLIKFG